MSAAQIPPPPYKGLVPYSEEDERYFFGREHEREIISANLLASRLTLLYGPSGVGKTSVLRAGVASHLRTVAAQARTGDEPPEYAVVVFSSWRDDPVQGLTQRVRDTVTALMEKSERPVPGSNVLAKSLGEWTQHIDGDLLIILDQFEEYFLYHANEDGNGTFAVEFPRAVNDTNLRVNFLLSMREDALARLDKFKGRILELFDNRLEVRHLEREAARAAIERPLVQYNLEHDPNGRPITIEPALTAAVLDQVAAGRFAMGEAGQGFVTNGGAQDLAGERIATPYLQLVMTRLWDEELGSGSKALRLATLERLGGSERIVKTHLDSVMETLSGSERDISARMFHHLVTPSGTKIAHTAPDLATYAGMPEAELAPVLTKLSSTNRILRPVAPPPDQPATPRYEIFHDVLAPAVIDWRARYVKEQELGSAKQEAQEHKKRADLEARAARQSRRFAIVVGMLSLLAVAAAAFALTARGLAKRQASLATSRGLAAAAVSNLTVDPERSLLLALHAIEEVRETKEAREALHKAVEGSRVLRTFSGHRGAVRGVAISPDGTRLATGGGDRVVRLWDIESGEMVGTLQGHTLSVMAIAFSADGAWLATASDDSTAKVWDVASRREVLTLRHTDRVRAAVFSPDGARLATASMDGLARIWDRESGREVASLQGHQGPVMDIAFAPDGRQLATASVDRTARIWDVARGVELRTLRGHGGQVVAVRFSPDGQRLATASQDGTAKVWNARSGQAELTLTGHQGWTVQAVFSPDGVRLATIGEQTAKVWDARTGLALFTIAGHTGWLTGVAFSPDGRSLATASQDGTASLWDATAAAEVATLEGHAREVTDVAFSPDDQRLATASMDGTVRVWDTATWELLRRLEGHDRFVMGVAYSPDGSRIASASMDGTVKEWDAETGQELRTLATLEGGLRDVAYSPDGRVIAVASTANTATLWDAATGTELFTLQGHNRPVTDVAFSPDGQLLATVSQGVAMKLWDVKTGRESEMLAGDARSTRRMAFSPDGIRFATTQGSTVHLWNISSSTRLLTLPGHTQGVRSLAFSPDGTRLATASQDRSIKLWDVATGEEQLTLQGYGNWWRLEFAHGGRWLAAASSDGTARVYALELDDLVQLAKNKLTRAFTVEECQRYLQLDECPAPRDASQVSSTGSR